MKFTALEEYGLRCLLHLAQREGESRAVHEVAADEGLTPDYAGKIFRVLLKAHLVESERGRNGGYRLARPADKITIGETLDALGGRVFDGEVCGRFTGDRHVCVHSTDCALRSLWRELQAMLDGVLTRMTLKDLVTDEHAMSLRMREENHQPVAAGGHSPGGPGLIQVEMLKDTKE